MGWNSRASYYLGIFLAIQLSNNKPLIKKNEAWHILRKHFQIIFMNYPNELPILTLFFPMFPFDPPENIRKL